MHLSNGPNLVADVDAMGLSVEAAQGYETFFIPAIFHQWPARLIQTAQPDSGDNVLEVGCGTGILTRELIPLVSEPGRVTGLDLSDSMLAVARQQCPDVAFQQGDVCELPFEDASFDIVMGQFMLMFVPEPEKGLTEIKRVLRPGGRVVLSVWQGLDGNPVYSALVEATLEIAGQEAARSLAWPFAMGDVSALNDMLASVNLKNVSISAHDGTAEFPSLESFVTTEVQAWVLADSVSDGQVAQIVSRLRETYEPFANVTGPINFPLNALIATATA